ncbi:FliH/SctL family protein [Planococcus sp. YIM B11945]|uniref:FliH/SctL family protein n=1 Tax=Planococcus sp. YIM B11945 TaxID=3435410 RepID=UPI003D7E9B41
MSNIIRSQITVPHDTKIIQPKKIETKKSVFADRKLTAGEQKQFMLQEFESLETQYVQLQEKIKREQEEAQTAIEQWWREKQEEAAREAQRLAEEASAQGFQAGFDQGVLEAENEFREKRQDMQQLLETAYAEKDKIIQQAEPFLLELSVKVAEKVIKTELKQHGEQLITVVKQALMQVEESEDVLMQVSSEDYPVILPFLEELKTYVRADSALKIIPVANLKNGDCMIHTASGSYDATVDGELTEIKKQLLMYFEEKTNDDLSER